MRKALHGDRVLASVTGVDHRGRREGAIVEVLERRMTRVVGRYSERAGIGIVIPDDRRVLHELLIPPMRATARKRRPAGGLRDHRPRPSAAARRSARCWWCSATS